MNNISPFLQCRNKYSSFQIYNNLMIWKLFGTALMSWCNLLTNLDLRIDLGSKITLRKLPMLLIPMYDYSLVLAHVFLHRRLNKVWYMSHNVACSVNKYIFYCLYKWFNLNLLFWYMFQAFLLSIDNHFINYFYFDG